MRWTFKLPPCKDVQFQISQH